MTDQPPDDLPTSMDDVPLLPARKDGNSPESDLRAVQAVALKVSGLSTAVIAERLGYSNPQNCAAAIRNAIAEYGRQKVGEYRDLENARYDRAQAAIWPQVLQGHPRAVDSFTRLSHRRCALNGLDAPKQIALTGMLRADLTDAIASLEESVLAGEVLDVHDEPAEP